jgi:hypothetical protein
MRKGQNMAKVVARMMITNVVKRRQEKEEAMEKTLVDAEIQVDLIKVKLCMVY